MDKVEYYKDFIPYRHVATDVCNHFSENGSDNTSFKATYLLNGESVDPSISECDSVLIEFNN